MEMTFNKAVMT